MRDKTFRKAIDVLDTDNGVSEDCYAFILSVLPEREAQLLSERVRATDGAFYLYEEDAVEIRNDYGFCKGE